jgi:hypothetical protein
LPAGRVAHVVFVGENGTLAINDNGYTVYDPKGKEVRKETVEGGDASHIANFIEAVRGSTKLNSEIEEAHKSTLLCHLGNIAHRKGRSLRCDPKNGHILEDKDALTLWSREYAKGWEPKM